MDRMMDMCGAIDVVAEYLCRIGDSRVVFCL